MTWCSYHQLACSIGLHRVEFVKTAVEGDRDPRSSPLISGKWKNTLPYRQSLTCLISNETIQAALDEEIIAFFLSGKCLSTFGQKPSPIRMRPGWWFISGRRAHYYGGDHPNL